jgi:hypothetical protein
MIVLTAMILLGTTFPQNTMAILIMNKGIYR